MKKELFISTVLHVSLLSLLFININKYNSNPSDLKNSEETSTSSQQTKEEKIVEKTKEKNLEVTLVEQPEEGLTEEHNQESECPNDKWYGGVGIVHNSETGEILDVPKGYPAYEAGVKIGDFILNPYELRGEPGRDAHLLLKRNDKEIIIVVTREKICLEKIVK